MNYEYNKILEFLYFEGYADSYVEAEYLLEDLDDDEFEELCENVSTGNAKRASFGGIQQRVTADEADRIRGRRPPLSPREERIKQEREEREAKTKQTVKQLLRRRKLPSGGISSDTPSLRGGGITPSSVAVRKSNELRARAERGEKGKTKFKRRANKIYNALSDRRKWGTPEARNEEFVIDYLINEGYTDNYDSAIAIYESMSDEWVDSIINEEPRDLTPEKEERVKQRMKELIRDVSGLPDKTDKLIQRRRKNKIQSGQFRNRLLPGRRRRLEKEAENINKEHQANLKGANKSADLFSNASDSLIRTNVSRNVRDNLPDVIGHLERSFKKDHSTNNIRRFQREEFILEYLLTHGYVNSYDSAVEIYESMSDEWMNDILEVFKGQGEEYKEFDKRGSK